MDYLTNELLTDMAVLGTVLYLVWYGLRRSILAPYRNKLMISYMECFDPYHAAVKKIFDEIIAAYQKCNENNSTTEKSYDDFFWLLQQDKRFRVDTTDHSVTFVYLEGRGMKFHRVVVFFNTEREFELRFIKLYYREEKKSRSFEYLIQVEIFRPDSGPDNDDVVLDPEPWIPAYA